MTLAKNKEKLLDIVMEICDAKHEMANCVSDILEFSTMLEKQSEDIKKIYIRIETRQKLLQSAIGKLKEFQKRQALGDKK